MKKLNAEYIRSISRKFNYSEINLICIIVLLLFTNQMQYKRDQFSSETRTFYLILWTTIIMCASDMMAGICRGQFFRGARAIIEISNLIFYESLSVISFLWLVYYCQLLSIMFHLGNIPIHVMVQYL